MELRTRGTTIPPKTAVIVEEAYGRCLSKTYDLLQFEDVYEEFVMLSVIIETEKSYEHIFSHNDRYTEIAFELMQEEVEVNYFGKAEVFNFLIERGLFFSHEDEKYNIPFEDVW